MKNATFWDSIKCAFSGMIYAMKTEKNFKYYFGIGIFFFIVNTLCRVELAYYIPYFIAAGGVFSTELINTAIEHAANVITKDICVEIKLIKDIAAGAVLFSGIVYFIVEFFIIGMRFL